MIRGWGAERSPEADTLTAAGEKDIAAGGVIGGFLVKGSTTPPRLSGSASHQGPLPVILNQHAKAPCVSEAEVFGVL